jgi:hypothetical protein
VYAHAVLAPWTQRLSVAWRPSLGFFEKRYEILRAIEDEKLLHQFLHRDDRISVRLGDPNHIVTFAPDRLEMTVLRPDGDLGRVLNVGQLVLEALRPSRILSPAVQFQWLNPIAQDYEVAKAQLVERLFGQVPHLTYGDTAALLDVATDEPASRGQVEFGLVNASEMPGRLARSVGYMTHLAEPEAPASLWVGETLPEVAFFCDSAWWPIQPPDPAIDAVGKLWEDMREMAGSIVQAFMGTVQTDA